jgi:pre-rRNA-processing protein TSR3
MEMPESSDEDDEDEDDDDDAGVGSDGEGPGRQGVTLDFPSEEEDDEDEEAEMAEIRRKILASKPFADSISKVGSQKEAPAAGNNNQLSDNMLTTEPPPADDSDAESGSGDEVYDDFDQIANATIVTDRTGIVARERQKKLEQNSASFSRTVIPAPGKW